MNFIQKTLTGLAIAATSVLPVEAMTDSFRDHYNLALAVEEVGIDFIVNAPPCNSKVSTNVYGYYYGPGKQLVVCQTNATNATQVAWTDEDLDTLRHEAHHLVQDCMDGKLDGQLNAVYDDPEMLARTILPSSMIFQIRDGYSDLSAHGQMMELEAFAVAAINDPQEQLRDIQRFCM